MSTTPHVSHLQAKVEKQRQEIFMLQRRIETLVAEKANLYHDLLKAKARADQLAAIVRGELK